MTQNVIIFGADGFIGSHFANYLQVNFGELNLRLCDYSGKGSSEYVDVRNPIEIKGDFGSSDIIINLAAIHRTPGHPDFDYFETNLKGSENVCEFAERMGIENIIFTSSIAPYGASEEEKFEETLPTPNTPYGISKLVSEEIHKRWAFKESKRRLLILRPGVVFGKGENGNFTRLATAIGKGIFFYPGRKDTIKAAIYVKELVIQSFNLFEKQKDQVSVYNFAYSPSYTIEEIASKISLVMGKSKPRIVFPAFALKLLAGLLKTLGFGRFGFHPARVNKLMTSTNISGDKLKNSVGEYRYSLDEALEDWYKDCDRTGLF